MINMKYSEIIKENKKLENNIGKDYKIALLSNIMVHQLKDIFEYSLRREGINASLVLGDYDNIVQDSLKQQNVNALIIFWEIYNFIDGLQYKIGLLNEKEFQDIIIKIKLEIDMVLNNIQNVPLVLINKFSSLIFNQNAICNNKMDELIDILNNYLVSKNRINLKIIDIDKVISRISITAATDLRFYYSSKTLYSIEFYKYFAQYIKPIFLSSSGKIKKALIFDCDNTLWKGILGEDGLENIKIYKEVQSLAVELAKSGVIIGLCSKNNAEDVDEVLKKHPDMVLRDEHIVIKKVNWNDKASNLKAIAKELNIGLDSLIFVDDSNFEVNLIKDELPMVEVFQVPSKEYEYAMMVRDIKNLFYNPSQTKEDSKKIQMYKAQIQRAIIEQEIGNIEEYLKSLELFITVYTNDAREIPRISQMTQKTNQFNLTTRRYTEKEIQTFIDNAHCTVIAIGVNDKFGDNGIVGLAIIKQESTLAYIDTLLMSCRVLGRNVEYKFMDIIVGIMKSKGVNTIKSEYIKTLKNEQVANLYDKFGFKIKNQSLDNTEYLLDIDDYKYGELNYIGEKNAK